MHCWLKKANRVRLSLTGLIATLHTEGQASDFLTQSGGPSQLELFDHKPDLHELAGTKLPASVRRGQRLTGMTKIRNN